MTMDKARLKARATERARAARIIKSWRDNLLKESREGLPQIPGPFLYVGSKVVYFDEILTNIAYVVEYLP